jgi:hypothetical protein
MFSDFESRQSRIVEQETHSELRRLGGHCALLRKPPPGGFLLDQGSGAGLPGHVSVDRQTIADAEASAAKQAVELPAPGAPKKRAPARR